MGDWGIKLSLPGADVRTAPDSSLIFSSSWPNLKIATNVFIPTASATFVNGVSPVYKHNLGFVPLFVPYGNNPGITGGQGNTGVQQVANISRQNISADNQSIYFIDTGGATGYPDIGLYVYYVDIEKPYTAPVVNVGSSTTIARSSDWGIKASKPNKNINSTDMRDFTIHSSSRAPMLHAVAPGITQASGSNFAFSYTHDLDYTPIFFAYVQVPSANNTYALFNGYSGLSTNGNTITLTTSAVQKCSIVILKDPFSINDNIIEVNV